MSIHLDPIAASMHALISTQETAMAETALCGGCLQIPAVRVSFELAAGSDHDGSGYVECSENEALECGNCGRNTFEPVS